MAGHVCMYVKSQAFIYSPSVKSEALIYSTGVKSQACFFLVSSCGYMDYIVHAVCCGHNSLVKVLGYL